VTNPLATPGVGSAWPGGRALTTLPANPALDLSVAVGQMTYTYRFALSDGVSGEVLGDIHPVRTGTLTHDTSRTTKRSLSLNLGKADTAAVNTATDRIDVFMTIPGARNPDRTDGDWPLGRYQFVDDSLRQFSSGVLSDPQLTDEMFLVDQAILRGISGTGRGVVAVLVDLLGELPITFDVEPCPFISADSWGIGTSRGQILDALSVAGDYWSPWFDNLGVLRFRRTFDPAAAVADIDMDAGYRVIRDDIVRTNDLLSSPNTIIVTSNNAASADPVVGVATVPVNAPNSVANRGFAISRVLDLQLSDATQAQAVANGLVQRQAIFEQVALSTPADPRHDGYNVIRWQGENWLELAWSMPLQPGEPMTHQMRRSYLRAGS
jgi:hypothetical protein